MAEEIAPSPAASFERQPSVPLESDLDRLATEFAKHKENPEMSGASDKEILKQAIRSMTVPVPAPRTPAPPAPAASDDSVLPKYMASATPATKLEVENLIRVAFKEGIGKAMHMAEKSNPFVLDALHDSLTGKLHDELKKRKLI